MTFDLNDEMAQAVTEQQLKVSLDRIQDEVRTDRPSSHYCKNCGADIPEGRRRAVRGVELCSGCQEVREHLLRTGTGRRYDQP